MFHISRNLTEFFSLASPEMRKHLKASFNNVQVAQAIKLAWSDNPPAAKYLLQHINAFYVLQDKAPRKGPDRDKPWMVAEFYLNDSMAKAELNARRELLHGALEHFNIHVNEIRIKTSMRSMRTKEPFAGLAQSLFYEDAADGELSHSGSAPTPSAVNFRELSQKQRAEALQTFKRACCLVFGMDAQHALDLINVAEVKLAGSQPLTFETFSDERKRNRKGRVFINLYGNNQNLQATFGPQEESILAHCRDLGLKVASIGYRDARGEQLLQKAFPPLSAMQQ